MTSADKKIAEIEMNNTGELDESWGFSHLNSSTTPTPIQAHEIDIYVTLSQIMSDSGSFHTIALRAFQLHAINCEYIADENDLRKSLNHMCGVCSIDDFTLDECEELWTDKLNFAEFYLLTKELFQTIHRTLNSDIEGTLLANEC